MRLWTRSMPNLALPGGFRRLDSIFDSRQSFANLKKYSTFDLPNLAVDPSMEEELDGTVEDVREEKLLQQYDSKDHMEIPDIPMRQIEQITAQARTRASLPQCRRRGVEMAIGSPRQSVVADPHITTGTAPLFISDSVTTLTGVRLPLVPQRAYGGASGVGERASTNTGTTRTLPVWSSATVAGGPEGRALPETCPVTPADHWPSPTRRKSLSQALRDMTGWPQGAKKTWCERHCARSSASGPQLHVLAWDNMVGVVPHGLKVVKVKRDVEDNMATRHVRVRFNTNTVGGKTWAADEYDRHPMAMAPLSVDDLVVLRNEMIQFKLQEMQVHPLSRRHNHIYCRPA